MRIHRKIDRLLILDLFEPMARTIGLDGRRAAPLFLVAGYTVAAIGSLGTAAITVFGRDRADWPSAIVMLIATQICGLCARIAMRRSARDHGVGVFLLRQVPLVGTIGSYAAFMAGVLPDLGAAGALLGAATTVGLLACWEAAHLIMVPPVVPASEVKTEPFEGRPLKRRPEDMIAF